MWHCPVTPFLYNTSLGTSSFRELHDLLYVHKQSHSLRSCHAQSICCCDCCTSLTSSTPSLLTLASDTCHVRPVGVCPQSHLTPSRAEHIEIYVHAALSWRGPYRYFLWYIILVFDEFIFNSRSFSPSSLLMFFASGLCVLWLPWLPFEFKGATVWKVGVTEGVMVYLPYGDFLSLYGKDALSKWL